MIANYKLNNYLLNTYPRLLTYSAFELYKRGFDTENKSNKSNKNKVPIDILIKKLLITLITIKKGNANLIKNKPFYKLLLETIDENKLIDLTKIVVDQNYDEVLNIIIIHLKNNLDEKYNNKYEYLLVKLANL